MGAGVSRAVLDHLAGDGRAGLHVLGRGPGGAAGSGAAGEEEGILEEADSELVRSAVEFGDKIVREIMTPRPRIFAVPVTLTVAEFTAQIKAKPYSRVPAYNGTLDDVAGIAFAHDVLQIADTDAHTATLASIVRPASFIPETKPVGELLREMQRQKQHMQIVIDEY